MNSGAHVQYEEASVDLSRIKSYNVTKQGKTDEILRCSTWNSTTDRPVCPKFEDVRTANTLEDILERTIRNHADGFKYETVVKVLKSNPCVLACQNENEKQTTFIDWI